MSLEFDVVVVGAGAAGLLAALRATDLGLSAVVIEKSHYYGGTSATSGGGLWIPNHGLAGHVDSEQSALLYLRSVARDARDPRLQSFVEHAPRMVRYLTGIGIDLAVFPGLPDYYSNVPGTSSGRALFPPEIDGLSLADDYFAMRELSPAFKFLNRYSLDLTEAFALSARPPGWRRTAARMLLKYWLDVAWRRKTPRDRRAAMGNALVGTLRRALKQRGCPVYLNTALERLEVQAGRIVGVQATSVGQRSHWNARRGVILAAGGFEQNQTLRDQGFEVATAAKWSLTPPGVNTGDAILAAQQVGAAVEYMHAAWWAPSMQLPSREAPNVDLAHQMFFDHRHPHSVCINRAGYRFVNECCSYDRFGLAMIADQRSTGANVPCWMIFDSSYRAKYSCGGIMPSSIMPDRRLPLAWWDHYLYRAATLAELALKIGVDATRLATVIATNNQSATTGVDLEFGRGRDAYDQFFGDVSSKPNPCIGPIERAPFYAIRVDLGDLGTKGGLKADAQARVQDGDGNVMPGLYAVGNSAGSPFGNCYPGAGATLAAALAFAFAAADSIAQSGGADSHEPVHQAVNHAAV
jgi:3-oxosteroid 1-dehydrogenase